MPAMAAGCLVTVFVFIWLYLCKEHLAAWIAGVLLAFDPLLVELSRIVRFYTFQHLAFLCGTIGVYWLLNHRKLPIAAQISILTFSIVAFFIAFKLQPVTLFGLGGLILLILIYLYVGKIRDLPLKHQLSIAGLTSIALIMGLGYAWFQGITERYFDLFFYADSWAAANKNNVRYYYAFLHANYAPLLALFPLLSILALRRQTGLAVLSLSIFSIGIAGLSLAAWKSDRYMSFLLPYFFIVTSIGLASGLKYGLHSLTSLLDQINLPHLVKKRKRITAMALTIFIFGFAMLGNYSILATSRLITRNHDFYFPLIGANEGTLSWSRASSKLKPLAENVDALVSSSHVKALYYIGKLDYRLAANASEDDQSELSWDHRTKSTIISSPEIMAAIMKCHRRGLFIVESLTIQNKRSLRYLVTQYVADNADQVSLPPEWGLTAYHWETPAEKLNQACLPLSNK
jgi:hypothetical protein